MPTYEKGREEFLKLYEELANISYQWDMFKDLYFATPSQIELLSSSAGVFFGYVYTLLLDSIILGISRMMDPLKQGVHWNFVLRGLVESLQDIDPELRVSLNIKLDKIDCEVDRIRSRRNKLLAHRDFETFIKPTDKTQVSYDEIETSIRLMGEYLNLYSEGIFGQRFENKGFPPMSVEKLVIRLVQSAEYEALVAEDLELRHHISQRVTETRSGEKHLYIPGHRADAADTQP